MSDLFTNSAKRANLCIPISNVPMNSAYFMIDGKSCVSAQSISKRVPFVSCTSLSRPKIPALLHTGPKRDVNNIQ